MVIQHHNVMHLRKTTKFCNYKACNCFKRAFRKFYSGFVGEIIEVEQAIDGDLTGSSTLEDWSFSIVFVFDIANKLLNEILHGDKPCGATIFVLHNGEVRPKSPHFIEGIEDSLTAGKHLNMARNLTNKHGGILICWIKNVANVDEPDDIVRGSANHGIPGVWLINNQQRCGLNGCLSIKK